MSSIPQNGVVILKSIPNSVQEVMVNRMETAYKNTDALAKQVQNNTDTVAKNTTVVIDKTNIATQKALEASNSEAKAKQYRDEAFNATPSGCEMLLQKVVWFDENGILNIGGLA